MTAAIGVRKLEFADMPAASRVHRTSFDQRLPWLAGLHTPEEDRDYRRCQLFETCEIWGAERTNMLVGVIAIRKDWVDQLYILPAEQGQRIGSQLLDIATAAYPELFLWTFQRNTSARRFYERHGFKALKETDGLDNEEKEPDVLYRWRRTGS